MVSFSSRASKGAAIFLGVGLVSLFILSQGDGLLRQFHVTKVSNAFDSGSWEKAIGVIADRGTIPEDDFVYGYPAGPLLFPAAFLVRSGLSVHDAYVWTTALLAALTLAGIALTAYVLRPSVLWWVGAPGVLLLHEIYSLGTPPSLLVSFLIALTALITLFVRERQGTFAGWWGSVFLGLVAALALSMRLDISILFLACVAVYLFLYARKELIVSVLVALMLYTVFDPFLWRGALEHVLAIYHKIVFHYEERSSSTALKAMGLYFSLGVLGMLAACVVHVRRAKEVVPTDFLYWLFASAFILFGILASLPYQPTWYFFPVMALLEVFSVLFIVRYVETVIQKTFSLRHQWLFVAAFLVVQLWVSIWTSDNMDLFITGPTLRGEMVEIGNVIQKFI